MGARRDGEAGVCVHAGVSGGYGDSEWTAHGDGGLELSLQGEKTFNAELKCVCVCIYITFMFFINILFFTLFVIIFPV